MSSQAVVGALRAIFGADTAAFEKGVDEVDRRIKKTSRNFKKFGDKLSDIGKTVSVGVTAPIAALGLASIHTAADFEELQSAFDVTFAGASDSVRKWSEETGDLLGRSTKEIQASALAFQDLFKKALDPSQSVELTKQFTLLTQDLASFKNLSNEVAQQKLFSGLTGEAEPLRSVGVFINAAATEAKALELGLEKVNGKYTDQQKIVARAAVIQEQLADAQGDVIRTADSTVNQAKRAAAAFEEMRVVIGSKLLPVITPLIEKVASALEWFTALPDPVVETTLAIAGIAAAIGPVLVGIGSIISVMAPLAAGLVVATGASSAFGAAMTIALGPIGLIAAAVIGLSIAYESAGEAAKNAEKEFATANDKIEDYIGVTADLQTDTELLKTKTEELNKAIGETGSASQDAARLEIDAIRQRISKNKELQRIYLDDMKLQAVRAQEAADKADNKQLTMLTGILEDRSKVYGKLRKDDGEYKAALESRFKTELDGLRDIIDGGEMLSDKERKRFEKLNDYFLERENRAQSTLEIEERIAALTSKGAEYKAPPPKTTPVDPPKPTTTKTTKKKGKSAAEVSREAAAAARENVQANLLLAEALGKSQREYELVATSMSLVKDGVRGTKEEIRELAMSMVDSEAVFAAARESRQAQIDLDRDAAQAIEDAIKAREDEAERVAKAYDLTVEGIKEEIENNKLLTIAMKKSSREYEIQIEILRILKTGHKEAGKGARELAEDLVKSREKLSEVTDETYKAEDALKKTGKTGVDAFTDVTDSFTGLVQALKSGDLEGILTGILGLLDQIFGISGGGSGSSGGNGGGIVEGIGGIISILSGGKSLPTTINSGQSYSVSSKSNDLFTPAFSAKAVPDKALGAGTVKVLVEANDYFTAKVQDEAAAVAQPISEVTTVQGVGKYNSSASRRNKQRLA